MFAVIGLPLIYTHNLDLNCILRTCRDACGVLSILQTPVTHVAFAHDTALGVELGYAVGTIPSAILAPDAGIGTVPDDAGQTVFVVGIDRAASEARGFQAVVASHGKIVTACIRIGAAFHFTHSSPENVRWVSVLLIACHYATFASDAFRHVEVEAIVFAFDGHAQRRIAATDSAQ